MTSSKKSNCFPMKSPMAQAYKTSFFETRLTFRRFWVKEARHSETKKRKCANTSIVENAVWLLFSSPRHPQASISICPCTSIYDTWDIFHFVSGGSLVRRYARTQPPFVPFPTYVSPDIFIVEPNPDNRQERETRRYLNQARKFTSYYPSCGGTRAWAGFNPFIHSGQKRLFPQIKYIWKSWRMYVFPRLFF